MHWATWKGTRSVKAKAAPTEPMSLSTCIKLLCVNKYSKQQFLRKERDIRQAIKYETDVPTILDCVMFYVRVLKFIVQ